MNKITNEGAFKINDLIYLDIINAPQMTPSYKEETRYAVTFTNKTIKIIWVCFIKHKGETSTESIKFIKILNNIGVTVKKFRTDRDTKYNKTKDYYDKKGIQ